MGDAPGKLLRPLAFGNFPGVASNLPGPDTGGPHDIVFPLSNMYWCTPALPPLLLSVTCGRLAQGPCHEQLAFLYFSFGVYTCVWAHPMNAMINYTCGGPMMGVIPPETTFRALHLNHALCSSISAGSC